MIAALRGAALGLLGICTLSVLALHALRPDLDIVAQRLSAYANGPHGWLMAMAFWTLGLGLAALGGGLVYDGRGGRAVLVGLLLGLAGAGMIVSGLYPTDPDGTATEIEAIHSAASGLATLAIVAAAVLWSMPSAVGDRSIDLDAVLAVLGVVLAGTSRLLHNTAAAGVAQRALWLALMAWLLLGAWRLGDRPAGHV